MPDRPPLDVSDITRQYDLSPGGREEAPVLPGDSGAEFRFATAPVRLGQGPHVWSTSTELAPVVPVCHDVNGYYRELGVDWRVTRKGLAVGYMDQGGMGSVRLTYVFKQLLNLRTRKAYDRMPKGAVFPDDYTDEALKSERKARKEAARRRIQGETVTVEAILDEMGYTVLTDDEVDSVSPIVKDQGKRRQSLWGYSYYAWRTKSYSHSESSLRRWQELLSTAASLRGVAPRVAIGITTLSDQSVMLGDVNGTPVAFFAEVAAPDLSVAQEAIELFLSSSPNSAEIPEESRIA